MVLFVSGKMVAVFAKQSSFKPVFSHVSLLEEPRIIIVPQS
jgi:hypothetical protein